MSVRLKYRGITLRSLLELSFVLMKETEGYILGETLLYEELIVEYMKTKKKKARYFIDFYSPSDMAAWEVKPQKRITSRIVLKKADAAVRELSRREISYKIVTENMISKVFTKKEVLLMDDVTIIKRKRKKR